MFFYGIIMCVGGLGAFGLQEFYYENFKKSF